MVMPLWSCTTCSKSFTRKGDLTRHELLHTGIKPHVCETCGKGFAQSSGLKTHRNVHSREKPYICGIGVCTKAFGDPSSRARHRKETHRREGAYKCIIADCGTRIKRRSAFVAHLRKHGLDSNSLDINAIVLQSSGKEISTSAYFAPPGVENKSHDELHSRSVSPSFLSDTSGRYTLAGEASHFTGEWLGDQPLDCQRVSLLPANNTLLPVLDQTANFSPGISHDVHPYQSSNLEDSFYFPSTVGHPLLSAPLNPPVLEPFPETGFIGSQSSRSSPLSTYSTLYTTDFNDELSLSLANNVSQESFLYNLNIM